jgi:hypothetical protein
MNLKLPMELIEIHYEEYDCLFSSCNHVFNTGRFNHNNSHRCNDVKYLVFKDGKHSLGLIAGLKNNILISPFSAPFGGLSFTHQSVSFTIIEDFVRLLSAYTLNNNFIGIKLVLPPLFYNEIFLTRLMNVLFREHFLVTNLDVDFYFDCENNTEYKDQVRYNARKNLSLSLESNLEFKQCTGLQEIKEIYEVIRANRAYKGYPMTMEYNEILATAEIIPTDFFLCFKKSHNVAAAIVYHVQEHIVYVPYWGDNEAFREIRAMNFMAYKLFEHYKASGIKKVHIGIATENSIPNYGLSDFKESIGCKMTPKFSFAKYN